MAFPVVARTGGELITDSIWNADIVANMNNAGPHLIVRKTVDESVASSVVQQNDDVLLLTMATNEIWQFELNLLVTGSSGGNFLGQFTFPSGTIAGAAMTVNPASATTLEQISAGSSPSAQFDGLTSSTTLPRLIMVRGVMSNGGSGGNLQLQWAQNTSTATATVVRANSTLWAMKLA